MSIRYDPKVLDDLLLFLNDPTFVRQHPDITITTFDNIVFQGRTGINTIQTHLDYLEREGFIKAESVKEGNFYKILPAGSHQIKMTPFTKLSSEEEKKEAKREQLLEKQLDDLNNESVPMMSSLNFGNRLQRRMRGRQS